MDLSTLLWIKFHDIVHPPLFPFVSLLCGSSGRHSYNVFSRTSDTGTIEVRDIVVLKMSAMFRKQRSASRIYESYTRLKDGNEFLCGCSHLCSRTSKSLSILRAVSVPWQLEFKVKFKGAWYNKERI